MIQTEQLRQLSLHRMINIQRLAGYMGLGASALHSRMSRDQNFSVAMAERCEQAVIDYINDTIKMAGLSPKRLISALEAEVPEHEQQIEPLEPLGYIKHYDSRTKDTPIYHESDRYEPRTQSQDVLFYSVDDLMKLRGDQRLKLTQRGKFFYRHLHHRHEGQIPHNAKTKTE